MIKTWNSQAEQTGHRGLEAIKPRPRGVFVPRKTARTQAGLEERVRRGEHPVKATQQPPLEGRLRVGRHLLAPVPREGLPTVVARGERGRPRPGAERVEQQLRRKVVEALPPDDEAAQVGWGEHEVRAPAVGVVAEALQGERVERGGQDLGHLALVGERDGFCGPGERVRGIERANGGVPAAQGREAWSMFSRSDGQHARR